MSEERVALWADEPWAENLASKPVWNVPRYPVTVNEIILCPQVLLKPMTSPLISLW
jgi:hypothetical protein